MIPVLAFGHLCAPSTRPTARCATALRAHGFPRGNRDLAKLAASVWTRPTKLPHPAAVGHPRASIGLTMPYDMKTYSALDSPHSNHRRRPLAWRRRPGIVDFEFEPGWYSVLRRSEAHNMKLRIQIVFALMATSCVFNPAVPNATRKCTIEDNKDNCPADYICVTLTCPDRRVCCFQGNCGSVGTDGACGTDGAIGSTDITKDAARDIDNGDTNPPAQEAGVSLDAKADLFVPYIFVPAPSGRALVPGGGGPLRSSNFSTIMTTGQSPGGNRVMRSRRYTFVGGLIGATSGNE